jgi:uncharacterized damage-inducible protein DinB
MSMELIRELWSYHHWANRRLFGVTLALGEAAAGREIGRPFSEPTIRGMFAHLYAADRLWLERWKGQASATMTDTGVSTLAELRPRWDALESEQLHFLGGLAEKDLVRAFEVIGPDGQKFTRPLGVMLLHVPNHATHHRSEIATMLTVISGSPPDTGIHSYLRDKGEAGRS